MRSLTSILYRIGRRSGINRPSTDLLLRVPVPWKSRDLTCPPCSPCLNYCNSVCRRESPGGLLTDRALIIPDGFGIFALSRRKWIFHRTVRNGRLSALSTKSVSRPAGIANVSQFSRHTLIAELHLRIVITSIAKRTDNRNEIISRRSCLFVSGERIKYMKKRIHERIKIYTSEKLVHRGGAIDEQWYQPRQTPASIHAGT